MERHPTGGHAEPMPPQDVLPIPAADPEASGNVSALERGFAVLHCFEQAPGPLSNRDLSSRTGIPKPTVSRLLATLVNLGYLRQAADGERYELAAGVLRLSRSFLDGLDIRQHARPLLSALADETGAGCLLGLPDGLDIAIVEACRPRRALLALRLDVGSRVSIAASAMGRACAAALPDADRGALLGRIAETSESPPAELRALRTAIDDCRRDGYALSLGAVQTDVNAIAVALRTADGEILEVNCGGPAYLLTEHKLRHEIAPRLAATARRLAASIGGAVVGSPAATPAAPADAVGLDIVAPALRPARA